MNVYRAHGHSHTKSSYTICGTDGFEFGDWKFLKFRLCVTSMHRRRPMKTNQRNPKDPKKMSVLCKITLSILRRSHNKLRAATIKLSQSFLQVWGSSCGFETSECMYVCAVGGEVRSPIPSILNTKDSGSVISYQQAVRDCTPGVLLDWVLLLAVRNDNDTSTW